MVARNSGGSACSADADVKAKTPIWRVPDEFTFQVDEETLLAEAVEFVFPESSNEKEEDELQVKIKEAFRSNHPKCIHCGELARPSVLMFGDGDWVEDRQGEDNYQRWEANMRHQCKKNDKKLVILEIGCGTNVATVRYHSNGLVNSIGENATLIRVNPEFPYGPSDRKVISILGRAVDSLQAIDRFIKE